jgi:hypothetical protein
MGVTARQVKKGLLFVLLAFVLLGVLMVAEQLLIKELDHRAIWQDNEFNAYLADPGPRNYDSRMAYDCKYRPIGWIYRYRICVMEAGYYQDPNHQLPERGYYLIIIGVKGYLSLLPEEGGGRETWDRTLIWALDSGLRPFGDQRKGTNE